MIKVRVMFNGKEVKTLETEKDEITIGRTPENDLYFDNVGVSKLHARVFRRGREYVLEDCRSTNGTKVKGKMIESTILAEGDVAEIVKHTLLFSFGGEAEGKDADYPPTFKM